MSGKLYKSFIVLLGYSLASADASYRCYKISKLLVIAPGYKFKPEGDIPTAITESLLDLGKGNVVLINWTEAANDLGIIPGFGIRVNLLPAIQRIGERVGEGLAKLSSMGMNREIHFIGFDYGAHLACDAGRSSSRNGLVFKEIVGLDPTSYGYEAGGLFLPIDNKCAEFVSVVHCDEGGYGIKDNRTIAHVNFWPNYGNYEATDSLKRQPGCPETTTKSDNEKLFGGDECSHDRCWQIYNQALKHPDLFKAGKAPNYEEWIGKDGKFEHVNYIGPNIDTEISGNFYLRTSSKSPYGLKDKGLKLKD